ncbi:arylsulfatase [Echinicola pacifica]|nr:arylsulfatase [Echinicola pacifica]
MMNRTSILFLGLLLCLSQGCQSGKDKEEKLAENKETRPPNIIFILADDLGYGDLSCYGQQRFESPNIDRLAAQGMLFTNHYAGTSVCSPSRASLMTGQHTGHVAIRDNRSLDPSAYGFREIEGQFPLADSILTLPEMMRERGYVTGAFGKWGLGGPDTEGAPNQQGFDEFYGYVCQSLAHNYYPDHLWHNQEKIPMPGNEEGAFGDYAPELMQRETLAFIEKNKGQPFFLFVPSPLPHAELIVPEHEMAPFEGHMSPGTPFNGVDSGPAFRQGGLASQDKPHLAFAAMVKVLDDQVGEIMAKVKELGIENNTLIIFTSDNGPHREGGGDPEYFDSNGGFKGIKRDLYEGGIRVPLIMSWPGRIAANTTNAHPSAFWDFMPSFAALAGAPVRDNWDGISMLPTMMGQENKQKKHPYLYWEYHGEAGKQAARMGDWKGVRTGIREGNRKIEIYNLKSDPGETTNLALEHPEILWKMDSIFSIAHTPSVEFKLGYLDE